MTFIGMGFLLPEILSDFFQEFLTCERLNQVIIGSHLQPFFNIIPFAGSGKKYKTGIIKYRRFANMF